MKTNPEEFYSNVTGKWAHLIGTYRQYLNKADLKALDDGIATLMQQCFTEEVMEELVDPKEESNVRKLGRIMKKQREKESLATQLHIDAHNKALGQTPIAGVTQTP